MKARALSVSRDRWLWLGITAVLVLLAQSAVFAQPSCCSDSGCCGGPQGEACTLVYGARGVVRDSVSGDPIAGATIAVLDVSGASAADGSFEVSGSRAETCNVDYYYSLLVTAPGYDPYGTSLYTSAVFPTLTIDLDPTGAPRTVTVSGTVAEFPACTGRMRGVTVILDPLGITTQTSVDATDGGRFTFRNVPAGEYQVRVLEGCNPFGCWNSEAVHVEASDVAVSLCMTAIDPNATPTPTPTVYPGPSITSTVCPVKTACVLGEQPLPCDERCGLGCGCEACPACPEGLVSAPRPNFCDCVPDPNVTPPPTSTPGHCLFPTPPLCPVGETARCVTEDGCDSDCSCVACDPCPPGLTYSGEPNSCVCLDPRTVTATPTPDTRTSTPTPTSDSGETPHPCPTRTPLPCPDGETTVCDTSGDPCGICECRAVPQGPGDQDTTRSSDAGGGCGIGTTPGATGTPWSWSLLLIAALVWKFAPNRPGGRRFR